MRHLYLDIDNKTLVEECRSGDKDAMSILYTRYATRMLHVITRYVNDRDSAHDILHDGFIAAFTRIDSLRDPEHIEFWLATIMKNLSLKYLQAQTVTSILEEIPETIDEPEIDDILDFATLESLIKQLPEGYQKVFRLAVLEGKSHKEISEILGIAPNSSSSQLFHAKLRLRELIKDYRLRAGLISLLLLIACSGLLFLSRKAEDTHTRDFLSADARPKKRISNPENAIEPTTEELPEETCAPIVAVHSKNTGKGLPSASADSTPENDAEENEAPLSATADESQSQIESNSVENSVEESPSSGKPERLPAEPLDEDYRNDYDRLFADIPSKPSSSKGWSAEISFDPGIISFNGVADVANTANPPANDPSHGPDDDKDPDQTRMSHIPEDVESSLGSAPRRHYLPISFALTAEKHLSSWLGLESGIGYSYLHTDFERYKEPSTCHWHYLEIPLKVNLYVYTSPRMKIYGSMGGRIAIPIYSYAQMNPNTHVRSGTFSSKTVWSAGGSIGAAFRLSKRVDLFVEPSLHYHFPQQCTIPNIWTDDEPWSISIPIGFRFNW
ncbi:MAG: sigma-70 family RNA polymerase sigma factor [Muribaculaceae bacterium]|nr:sigma-70 family RNA polymerase sigma factor [Muribaculaceae bacterium]